jgi:hypothetical protein
MQGEIEEIKQEGKPNEADGYINGSQYEMVNDMINGLKQPSAINSPLKVDNVSLIADTPDDSKNDANLSIQDL